MIWLSGVVRPELAGREDVGIIATPTTGRLPWVRAGMFRRWAADNGCFSQRAAFDLATFLDWLASMEAVRESCLFAVAPDVVGDAAATMTRAHPVLPMIRALGYPAAFVAQDGLETMPVPWEAFDCLFVGGSTAWKLSEAAYGLVAEAKRRGKWAHMGRCNSLRRLRAAALAGYDSADGTFLARAPDHNVARMERWFDQLARQPALPLR